MMIMGKETGNHQPFFSCYITIPFSMKPNNYSSLSLRLPAVSIENRSEEERKEAEGLAGSQHGGHTESNAVATP